MAVERLAALDDRGTMRLADILSRPEPAPTLDIIAAGVPAWPDGYGLDRARGLVADIEAPPRVRYRVAEALAKAEKGVFVRELLDAACRPGPAGWFGAGDYHWLESHCRSHGVYDRDFVHPLTRSPHPHAYDPAVAAIINGSWQDAQTDEALVGFLEAGPSRMRELRQQAANHLAGRGFVRAVLPLLLQGEPTTEPDRPELLAEQPVEVVLAVANGFVLAGEGETAEEMILALVSHDGVDALARQDAMTLLMEEGTSDGVREHAGDEARTSLSRSMKLRRVAETFAWGVRVGRELTGKRLRGADDLRREARLHALLGEQDLHHAAADPPRRVARPGGRARPDPARVRPPYVPPRAGDPRRCGRRPRRTSCTRS